MATGNTIIPFGSNNLDSMSAWMIEQGAFYPPTLRYGRFPTQNELRQAIQKLGFSIDEQNDWYVTSEDDYTEIWFSGDPGQGDQPVDFWCRRGEIIALDIGQSLTNLCGALIIVHHSDGFPVLLAPDDAFSFPVPENDGLGFYATMTARVPALIVYLPKASTPETLFILSQLRQTLRKAYNNLAKMHELIGIMKPGLPGYLSCLSHADRHVRRLAFELVTLFREGSYDRIEGLGEVIARERDTDTKTHMIDDIAKLIVSGSIGDRASPEKQGILDILHKLSGDRDEAPSVRLAAVRLLADSQPGLITPAMRTVLLDALTDPDGFALKWNGAGTVFRDALDALPHLLINHRVEILMEALPKMDVAEDAHEAARALLDYAFFGAIRQTGLSSLPDTATAERPAIDEDKFRSTHRPFRNWLYPANPTRLTVRELTETQREVLHAVITPDIPWMVHSNLLEKYGLPPTRAAMKAMLDET